MRLLAFLILFTSCGAATENKQSVEIPPPPACSGWIQLERNYCGGLWFRSCLIANQTCTHLTNCGAFYHLGCK